MATKDEYACIDDWIDKDTSEKEEGIDTKTI